MLTAQERLMLVRMYATLEYSMGEDPWDTAYCSTSMRKLNRIADRLTLQELDLAHALSDSWWAATVANITDCNGCDRYVDESPQACEVCRREKGPTYLSRGNKAQILGMLCDLYREAEHNAVGMYAGHDVWLRYAVDHTWFYWGIPNSHPHNAWLEKVAHALS